MQHNKFLLTGSLIANLSTVLYLSLEDTIPYSIREDKRLNIIYYVKLTINHLQKNYFLNINSHITAEGNTVVYKNNSLYGLTTFSLLPKKCHVPHLQNTILYCKTGYWEILVKAELA